ncbi:glucan endo-1,3-beta-glucosidase-like [Cucumis melo var. makuwa]|uniref:glucan endo-1,3-beta-D-glucosidase n=1 Tax=Cucumis melo var. makuwa TaxID=1194695 RepID=A0A5D3D5V2_CUCMM|nr:glucan endo-1,3-beta-glucosidase-like [Cucumis melo var. makuwa]
MAMAINYNNDDEDSMALFPFGSSSGFGSFGSGCYHPHLPSPTVMRNIYSAIVEANLEDQIKVSTVIFANLLGCSYPPSEASFSREANELMEPIVCFLVENASPLLANLYPYYTYMSGSFTLDYALFNGPSVVKDGKFDYHNVIEVMVDAIYAALEKCGGPNVSIVVSESGWPSAGDAITKVENGVAGSYYSNLIKFVQGGTQRRPGRAIETYLFAMFDENLRSSVVEKHFGLFTYDQKHKYVTNLNFSLY